jgi:hypothetical protein
VGRITDLCRWKPEDSTVSQYPRVLENLAEALSFGGADGAYAHRLQGARLDQMLDTYAGIVCRNLPAAFLSHWTAVNRAYRDRFGANKTVSLSEQQRRRCG